MPTWSRTLRTVSLFHKNRGGSKRSIVRQTHPRSVIKRVILTLALLLGANTVVVASDFDDGVKAYDHKDYATAFTLFKKAAEQGSTKAQYNLGVVYEQGQGVAQDYQEATHWYTKAAEAGDTRAQYNLGRMYSQGQGMAQDYQQAVVWFRKAAEAGDTRAQYNLGHMYYGGVGVPQDYILAHMWTNLAAIKNNNYVKLRDTIALNMTPSQIAEAQQLAREWKPKGK